MHWEMEKWGEGNKLHILMMLLVAFVGLAGLAALASWVLGRVSRRSLQSSPGLDDAIEVVRKRYVRGRIGREQYLLMLRDLKS